ncbi:hypothetical protein C8R48DRAFT_560611, partial [Suillus tomentosus]
TILSTKNIEIKIGTPTEFNGDCDEFKRFMLNCNAYLNINDKIYNDDKKKVIFTLSFMTKGNAATWKEDFMRAAQDFTRVNTAGNVIGYGTWAAFKVEFKNAFRAIDPKGTAMSKVRALEMRGDLQTYISNYHLLTHKAGITEDVTKVEFFHEGLDKGLRNNL